MWRVLETIYEYMAEKERKNGQNIENEKTETQQRIQVEKEIEIEKNIIVVPLMRI